jgi:hypothetical protein
VSKIDYEASKSVTDDDMYHKATIVTIEKKIVLIQPYVS